MRGDCQGAGQSHQTLFSNFFSHRRKWGVGGTRVLTRRTDGGWEIETQSVKRAHKEPSVERASSRGGCLTRAAWLWTWAWWGRASDCKQVRMSLTFELAPISMTYVARKPFEYHILFWAFLQESWTFFLPKKGSSGHFSEKTLEVFWVNPALFSFNFSLAGQRKRVSFHHLGLTHNTVVFFCFLKTRSFPYNFGFSVLTVSSISQTLSFLPFPPVYFRVPSSSWILEKSYYGSAPHKVRGARTPRQHRVLSKARSSAGEGGCPEHRGESHVHVARPAF